jgi:membrane associated rhomboid family serine protease
MSTETARSTPGRKSIKMHRNNHINILIWITILVCPFLLQIAGVINTGLFRVDQNNGPLSILSGVFLHGDYRHLVGNLVGLLLASSLVYHYFKKMYIPVIAFGIIIPGAVMYWLDKPMVGISGLLFTMIWFIIIRGLMSRDRERFMVACFAVAFYGLSINTAIPLNEMSRIAWQAHAAGLLTGASLALYGRFKK